MDNYVNEKLVNLITANVLRKMDIKVPTKIDGKSCLVLIPNICLGIHEYLNYLTKEYTGYSLFLGINDNSSTLNFIDDHMNVNVVKLDLNNIEFIKLLERAEVMIVLGLKINEMKALIQTEDTELINQIIFGRLMANKTVNILINPNEQLLNQLKELITGLRNLGIEVTNIKQVKHSNHQKVDLITENYVIDLKKKGIKTLLLNNNQLITPLAKDKLYELKIKVKYIEEDQE